ncbi:MAG: hypothetical protein HZC36_01645 [Armatimonadetes bacterium]|nr:hypothetical protein [Armatimonadota bacterium]
MKRWWIAFGFAVFGCLGILASRSSSPSLLADSDTAVLLEAIEARKAPLSWFAGDWPLGNHFYRPVSTLTFELDHALWGDNAAGFGLTNALLCALAVLALFWFLRELTESPFLAGTGSALFVLWTLDWGYTLVAYARWLALLPLIGLLLPKRRPLDAILGAGVAWFICTELFGMWPLQGRMIGWLPGRTASTVAVFALSAMAAYARYERLSAARAAPPPPSPYDLPSYKRAAEPIGPSRAPWLWAGFSAICVALALGCYEQAVMLPAALLGVALTLRWRGYRVRFGWQALFWGLLGGYLALRYSVLPHTASGYQQQQFRTGDGVTISLVSYLLPVYLAARAALRDLVDLGPITLFLGSGVNFYIGAISTWSAVWEARKQWILPLSGWAFSTLAFLPMAWLKHFEHYHYWPMALRSLMVVSLLPIAAETVKRALSPRAVQAPPRPSPAPGSLPHP